MSELPEPTRPLKDYYSYNQQSNQLDLAVAEATYKQLLDRKEKLVERSTFGLLALNGASVIAVASSLGKSDVLEALGIGSSDIAFSVAAFLLGGMTALISIWLDSNHLTERAGDQFRRLALLRRISATLHDKISEQSADRLGRELDELPGAPPVDFAFSGKVITLLNISGSAWLGGIGLLAARAASQINWCAH